MMKEKKIKNIQLRTLSILRKRRKSKEKKKQRNIFKNRGTGIKQDKISKNKYTNKVENVIIEGGTNFTLFDNPDNVLDIVNRLDKYKKSTNRIRNIRIDLSNIEKIDIAAISFLLAKVNELSRTQRIRIWGDTPSNPDCKKIFFDSGFLDYMTDLSGNKFKKQSENFIINVGSETTRNEKVGKTIERSIKYLTGKESKYPPVYSIVQEICSNSVEWANPKMSKNINWFLGVSYNGNVDNPEATYVMTDVGYGIISTLNRRFGKYIEALKLTKDTEVLERAFDRKYGSKSGESNRNRGLPLIKDRYTKLYIDDLIVITNNVLLDFNKPENTKIMSKSLPGTFYCWKINLKCIETWNKIEIN